MAPSPPNHLPIPQVPIQDAEKPLFASINAFVHAYMSKYDNSHDYQHILRVLSNTNRTLQTELLANPSPKYDTTALLHDVGDHKYVLPGQPTHSLISSTLLSHGAHPTLAQKVETIVTHVSYSHEIKHPDAVAAVLTTHPELAIVQDADRLDAIGAVGIARCFSFGAARFPEQGMERAIVHFGEKLERLAGMMKTGVGREMARGRTEALVRFRAEWERERELSFGMV